MCKYTNICVSIYLHNAYVYAQSADKMRSQLATDKYIYVDVYVVYMYLTICTYVQSVYYVQMCIYLHNLHVYAQ